MKKLIVALALAGIALAGCSAGKQEAKAPATTAPTTTVYHAPPTTAYRPPTTTTTQQYHVAFAARLMAVFPGVPIADLIDLGVKTCAELDERGSIAAMGDHVDEAIASGELKLSSKDVAIIVDASIREFCPKYLPELNAIQQ